MIIGLKITEDKSEDVKIFRLEGRLDAASAPVLEKKLSELFESSLKYLLIDFSKVDYLSSAGMRLLLSYSKRLKNLEGKLAFCSITEEVMEVIKMAGFERILNIYSKEADALKALKQ
jgi:anti-sigma B factor antagonist/stage II sporulation protein AA (anti-sigma F factor antagonist)